MVGEYVLHTVLGEGESRARVLSGGVAAAKRLGVVAVSGGQEGGEARGGVAVEVAVGLHTHPMLMAADEHIDADLVKGGDPLFVEGGVLVVEGAVGVGEIDVAEGDTAGDACGVVGGIGALDEAAEIVGLGLAEGKEVGHAAVFGQSVLDVGIGLVLAAVQYHAPYASCAEGVVGRAASGGDVAHQMLGHVASCVMVAADVDGGEGALCDGGGEVVEGGDLLLGGGGVTDIPQQKEEVNRPVSQGGFGGGGDLSVGVGQDVGLYVALGGNGGEGVFVGLGGGGLGVVITVISQRGDVDAVGLGLVQQGHGDLDLVDVGIGAHDAVYVVGESLAVHYDRGHGGFIAEEDDLVVLLDEEHAGVAGEGDGFNRVHRNRCGVHVTPPCRWAYPCRG